MSWSNKDTNNLEPATKKQRTAPPQGGTHFFYQDSNAGGSQPRPAANTRPPSYGSAGGSQQKNYQNLGSNVPRQIYPNLQQQQDASQAQPLQGQHPALNQPSWQQQGGSRAKWNPAVNPHQQASQRHHQRQEDKATASASKGEVRSGLNTKLAESPAAAKILNSEDPKIKAILDKCKITPKLLDYVAHFKFPYAHDVGCYEKLLKIGQGTFGEVFKARCKRTGQLVALKKILMENEKEGFPITALREIKMLQRLRHPHITDLKEICAEKTSKERFSFYLVFAFADHDLAGLLSSGQTKLKLVEIKTMMKHILEGLYRIHSSNILHRDMKAANVLISHDGVLKLADFGLARLAIRSGGHTPCYTNRVVTLWYRPPELLLGTRNYGPSIDIWGAGCIMAELWTRSPILQGETEQKQLILISNLCGSINPSTWTECDKLPLYKTVELPQNLPRRIRERLKSYLQNEQALSLVDSMMTLNPEQRPSALQALDHHFFFEVPRPLENLKELLAKLPTNMFEYTAGIGAHANRGRTQAQHYNNRAAASHVANRPSGSFNQQTHHHNRQQQQQSGGSRMGGQQR